MLYARDILNSTSTNQPNNMKIPAIALFALTATSSSIIRPVDGVGFPGIAQTINGPTEVVAIDPNSATTGTAGAASSVLRGSSNDGGEAEIGDDVEELRRGGGGTVAGFDPADPKSSCKGSSKTSQLTCPDSGDSVKVTGDVVLTEGLVCDQVIKGDPAFIIDGNVDCKGNLIIGPGVRTMPNPTTGADSEILDFNIDSGIAFRLMPGASIKNCVISGFGVAIEVFGEDTTVHNVVSMNNNAGLRIDNLPSGGKFSFKDIRITNFRLGIYINSQPSSEYVFQNIDIHQPNSNAVSAFYIKGDFSNSKFTIDKLDATGDGEKGEGILVDFDDDPKGAEIKVTNSIIQGWDFGIGYEYDSEEDITLKIEKTLVAGCVRDGVEFDSGTNDGHFFRFSESSSILNGENGLDVDSVVTDFIFVEDANLSGNGEGIRNRKSDNIYVQSTLIQNNDEHGLQSSPAPDCTSATCAFTLGDDVKICNNNNVAGGATNNGVYDGPADFFGKNPVCDTSTLPGTPNDLVCQSDCLDDNVAALASCVEITNPASF